MAHRRDQEGQPGVQTEPDQRVHLGPRREISEPGLQAVQGLFRLSKFKDALAKEAAEPKKAPAPGSVKEEDFYAPFADGLKNEIEDATKAIPPGATSSGTSGCARRDRATGIAAQRHHQGADADRVGGIKTDTAQLVTAFGQACAYKLFSHKAYLVVPCRSPGDEISRVDSLCQIFGIGFVTFNAESPSAPDFQVRDRPARHEPGLVLHRKRSRTRPSENAQSSRHGRRSNRRAPGRQNGPVDGQRSCVRSVRGRTVARRQWVGGFGQYRPVTSGCSSALQLRRLPESAGLGRTAPSGRFVGSNRIASSSIRRQVNCRGARIGIVGDQINRTEREESCADQGSDASCDRGLHRVLLRIRRGGWPRTNCRIGSRSSLECA
jgi:hypothetical protein